MRILLYRTVFVFNSWFSSKCQTVSCKSSRRYSLSAIQRPALDAKLNATDVLIASVTNARDESETMNHYIMNIFHF